jgi:hypothetical protein
LYTLQPRRVTDAGALLNLPIAEEQRHTRHHSPRPPGRNGIRIEIERKQKAQDRPSILDAPIADAKK